MLDLFTPARRRGSEILDDPATPDDVRTRSIIGDVARSNVLFGGARAALRELDEVFAGAEGELTLLDVGTGAGDIPLRAARLAARRGIRLTTIGLDGSETLARASRARTGTALAADALALPFEDRSVDIALCSQLLHHFVESDGLLLLRELNRVARRRVVISDLRRSWLAASAFWLASFPLGFHPVTRHDGVLSVLRGFTAPELREMARRSVGASATAHRRLGFRVTASWRPTATDAR